MALTPRSTDFSARYNELVEQAGLAQHSAVRGCMVIKPYGYAIWENMQKILDHMFKATGIGEKKHTNAYFPLFIPKSFFTKEAKHVEGFATEAAIVTHYRLKKDEKTGEMVVDPEAKLDEELIVRPTSETIIWNTYKDRIQSYRDLPILVNQRANVVRREMRTRLFLRTAEFLRQEGHTAHATADEAMYEAKQMRDVYNDFFVNVLAMSGVMGEKSENERFAGAENTYTIECMMQDGKALQSCTSHYLGQNFGKAFDVQFLTKENTKEYAYATSRGISTRALGGMIMSHSDDKGLVLPPAIAPIHVVIVPFFKTDEELENIKNYLTPVMKRLESEQFAVFLSSLAAQSDVSFSQPVHFNNKDTDHGPREGKETQNRTIVQCFAQHKQTGKYLLLKRKQSDRVSPIGGGIEEGQTIADAMKAEILQEAGYSNISNIQIVSSNVSFEGYTVHKDRNIYGHTTIMHCEIDGDPLAISDEEKNTHEPFFADESEVYDMLKPYNIQYLRKQYLIWKNKKNRFSRPIIYKVDTDSEKSPGWKFNQYELEGVPVRLTVGKKEMEHGMIELYRRDTGEKKLVKIDECAEKVMETLYDIQNNLFAKNKTFREGNTVMVNTRNEFIHALDEDKFVLAHRDGTVETEKLIKEETKATIRCIPGGQENTEKGNCIRTGKASQQRVLFARSY